MRPLVTVSLSLVLVAMALAGPVAAEEMTAEEQILADISDKPVKTWHQFVEKHDGTCMGKKELILQPEEHKIGGKNYKYLGYKIDVLDPDKDSNAVLGVFAATKNFLPETQENLKQLAETFKKRKVDAVLVLGDLAYVGTEITDILSFFADRVGNVPILVVIGNAESRGPFGRAMRNLAKKRSNFFNLNAVRVFNGDDFSVVSIPGYYDKRFVEGRASCVYHKRDLKDLKEFFAEAKGPIVLASHGPPQTTGGKAGIDSTPSGKNVGDPLMAKAIEHFKVPFGTFSHILEAGGTAWNFAGKKPVKEKTWSDSLFVNVGAANALDWNMNSGWVSQGTAMIVSIDKGKQAQYELIKMTRKEVGADDDEWGDDFDFDE